MEVVCPHCKKKYNAVFCGCPYCGKPATRKKEKYFRGGLVIIVPILLIWGMASCFSSCGKNGTRHRSEDLSVLVVSSRLVSDILHKGYGVKGRVYATRSADYKKVYFVGAVVVQGSSQYSCIWTSNSIDADDSRVMFSMNDEAHKVSGIGDGRTNKNPISQYDDGYNRIADKLK